MKKNVPHDKMKYHVVPSGENQLFITNWTKVVAVFAAKTAGVDENAMDVITMDGIRVELLKAVFWDMNELSYKTEKVKHGDDKETILHITLTSRGYKEMMDFYNFTNYQKQVLYELMQPEYAQMLSELVGTLGVMGGQYRTDTRSDTGNDRKFTRRFITREKGSYGSSVFSCR